LLVTPLLISAEVFALLSNHQLEAHSYMKPMLTLSMKKSEQV